MINEDLQTLQEYANTLKLDQNTVSKEIVYSAVGCFKIIVSRWIKPDQHIVADYYLSDNVKDSMIALDVLSECMQSTK